MRKTHNRSRDDSKKGLPIGKPFFVVGQVVGSVWLNQGGYVREETVTVLASRNGHRQAINS
ncbi:hypothetical protein ABT57_17340 [Photobacterium ganghwense]|uniref:Uncharacterized protein n=1 Tax=Photobacterium ganghwense TaxID=320778 RepID=A0A0J1H7I0_9GAMM|nr:hypothetical protein ABT57_17340 [Photobacterium ganghwense]